jgi:hypothetical protein
MEIVLRLIGNHLPHQQPSDRKIKNIFLYCLVLIASTSLSVLANEKHEKVNRFSCQTHTATGKNLSIKNGDENTDDDKARIFQKCLDLPELQAYYPKNADGTHKQVYVMQAPIPFPADLAVSKFKQNVAFLTRPTIYSMSIDAFLLFKEFSIEGDSAKVAYNFNYNYTSSRAVFEMILTLQKIDNVWTVMNTETKNR